MIIAMYKQSCAVVMLLKRFRRPIKGLLILFFSGLKLFTFNAWIFAIFAVAKRKMDFALPVFHTSVKWMFNE